MLSAVTCEQWEAFFFFFQAEDGIRDAQESRGLGDVYKRQGIKPTMKVSGPGMAPTEKISNRSRGQGGSRPASRGSHRGGSLSHRSKQETFAKTGDLDLPTPRYD
eukprot:TRINITY_DN9364_c0_g3_i1.p2 TRINITY_DN9364_c0_g3~~TRINITY_DN9364_c0_g3_i1.p2  ORF type:complete len:105 (+),score=15.74 TRINITY_DN9364_c0_g3_i1:68-382(+)